MPWLLLVAITTTHAYDTSKIGRSFADLTACTPDDGCERNRRCAFGSDTNYEIARKELFKATGRSENCFDRCICAYNPHNIVNQTLEKAKKNSSIYSNNEICNNPVILAAMYYHTSGFTCENVFREAQRQVIQLCGKQNGASCQGQCTEQYQIDTPTPMCEQQTGISDQTTYAIFAYVLFGCILWSWTAGVEISENKLSSRFRTTRTRFKSRKDVDFDDLLGSFF